MIKMKKNRLIKRAAIFFLSFILVFSNSLVLYADEFPEEEVGNEAGLDGEIPGDDGNNQDNPDEDEPGEQAPQENEPEEEDQNPQEPQDPQEPEEENEPQEEEKQEEEKKEEEKKEEEKKEEEKKEEEKTQVFKITVDHDVLSFGTISTSDKPRPLSFQIKNEGSGEAVLGWSQTDSTGDFL